jgi:FKBP-type peptidyl-prolyl cis-trans isomerase FklB
VLKTTLTPGNGPMPKPGFTVEVKYDGYLPDGTLFDSSSWRGERGLQVRLGDAGVIEGWNVGTYNCTRGAQAVRAW